jgi:hypothetical protein
MIKTFANNYILSRKAVGLYRAAGLFPGAERIENFTPENGKALLNGEKVAHFLRNHEKVGMFTGVDLKIIPGMR